MAESKVKAKKKTEKPQKQTKATAKGIYQKNKGANSENSLYPQLKQFQQQKEKSIGLKPKV